MATSGSILGNPVRRREDPGHPHRRHRVLRRPADRRACSTSRSCARRSPTPCSRRSTRATPSRCRASSPCTRPTTSTSPDHHGFMMLPPTMNRPPLARDRVRFVGDIVAVVVAETKAQAVDAAEAVIVDYDPLPAVVDPEAAIEPDAPVVFEAQGSNIANGMGTGPVEGVLDDADVVVSVAHRQPARRAGADGAGRDRRRARRARGRLHLLRRDAGPARRARRARGEARARPRRSCAARTRRSAAGSARRPGSSSST